MAIAKSDDELGLRMASAASAASATGDFSTTVLMHRARSLKAQLAIKAAATAAAAASGGGSPKGAHWALGGWVATHPESR